jgi:membrane protein implicated in regulation of membrane protease activity
VRARARDLGRRAAGYAAAAILTFTAAAALLQLAVQIAGFPAPVAAAAFTVSAVVSSRSLRRYRRARAGHRHGPATRLGPGGRSARI